MARIGIDELKCEGLAPLTTASREKIQRIYDKLVSVTNNRLTKVYYSMMSKYLAAHDVDVDSICEYQLVQLQAIGSQAENQ